MKESKSLDRFKKQAQEFNKLIEGKSDEEIERLVSNHNQRVILVKSMNIKYTKPLLKTQ
jgi:hypothetical protein